MAKRTRRVYDRLATVYPVSSYLFHSAAHRVALEMSGVRDGKRILEVGTGSGELFRRLVSLNPKGRTIGIDFSHAMAARTHRTARERFPHSSCSCNTASACSLPLADQSFDFVFSSLMMELLDPVRQRAALEEFHRVLRPGGRLTLVLIGEDSDVFNWLFRRCVRIVPAFWGPQIESTTQSHLEKIGFHMVQSRRVRQNGYPTLILTLERGS